MWQFWEHNSKILHKMLIHKNPNIDTCLMFIQVQKQYGLANDISKKTLHCSKCKTFLAFYIV